MGFSISWIGFHGLTKAEVLELVGAVDTGVVDEANEAPLSGAEIPRGWYILFSNDFSYVSKELLKSRSARGVVIACQVHEGCMVSAACGYDRGTERWAVRHVSEIGIRDLTISGSPPPAFAAIRDRLSGQQNADGGADARVDYFFDIPIETASAVCAYRHDRWKFDWGRPVFTVLNTRNDQNQ